MSIEQILKLQRRFFDSGVTLTTDFRKQALEQLRAEVQKNERKILDALHADLNKTDFESYMTEMGIVLNELCFVRKHLDRWMRTKHVPTPLYQFSANSYVQAEPYGLTLILAPWNYPFQLCLGPLIGAMAAGNCAVVKPSAYAPATSHVVAELLSEIFPPEYIAVVEGGRQENASLLEQKFDYIFFTGSVAVGKRVLARAAQYLTPVSLELGGKSPCIVEKTANLKLAAKRVAFGKFLNAGQTCVAPDHLLVQESVKGPFLDAFREAVGEFFPNGDYSAMPLIVNEKHYQRIMGLIEGERVLLGGNGDPKQRFIEPTVLDEISWESPIMQEEVFGPVLPVLTYRDLDELIRQQKTLPKPLALYLFTQDRAVEKKVLQSLSFGGGCINDTVIHFASSYLGFGGVGMSGQGSYHGKKSFDTFTHFKSIMKKHTWFDLPLRYLPPSPRKETMLRRFLK